LDGDVTRALLIIDVQNDFTEGGALGVDGGDAVAEGITRLMREDPTRYDVVIASRDWHDGDNDNGGHFATDADPDYVDTWPVHCVAGTPGADYDAGLDARLIDVHIRKGQGRPAYSIFEGTAHDDAAFDEVLDRLDVTDVDVAGIATDYCVRASALDALGAGHRVRVLTDLVAGVAQETSAAALEELREAGALLVTSADIPGRDA
jgi:nicotinamidase/pyrazinamidase